MRKFFSGHTLVTFWVVLILIFSGGGMILFGAHEILDNYLLRKGIGYIAVGSFIVALGFVILWWGMSVVVQRSTPPPSE